jgi:hypothetical protein
MSSFGDRVVGMERICDMMRAGGAVVGHVVGQASNAGILTSPPDLHPSESQQLSESIGRVAPIVLAERISTTLADKLIKSTVKTPWHLARIKPTLRIFTNDMVGGANAYEEVTFEEDPDTFITRLRRLRIFERTTQMVFITHGFIHDVNIYWLIEMKDALLGVEDMAVVFIGWGGGSNIGIDRYPHAVRNIEAVGCWVGNYAREIKRFKSDYKLWGIGHSLGAHLIGFAGKCSMRSFDRITGLDPAGPEFERDGATAALNSARLDPTDAKFVDVIHTDGYASPFSLQAIAAPTNHFGTLVPMGTIDFYPNWGYHQPNSGLSIIANHNSSFEYFITSIRNPGHFKTNLKLATTPSYMRIEKETQVQEEWVEMGYHCKGGTGCYYVDTKKETQYGLFMFP